MTLDRDALEFRLDMKFDFKYYVSPETLDMCDVVRGTGWAAGQVIEQILGTESYTFGQITHLDVDRKNNVFTFLIALTPNFDKSSPLDYQMRCDCYPYLIGSNYRYLEQVNRIISGLGSLTGIPVPGRDLKIAMTNLSKLEGRDDKGFYLKLRPWFPEKDEDGARLQKIAELYNETAAQQTPKFEVTSGYDAGDKTLPYVIIKQPLIV